MRITERQLRQIIREELQREFMSSRTLKLSDFGGDLPPDEPSEPEREWGGGHSGIKAWYVSPMEMRHEGGVGTESGGRYIVGRSTLDQFLRKWSVSAKDSQFVRRRVEEVLAKIDETAFDYLEDDDEEPERPPRGSYAMVTLDLGPPPRAHVLRYDGWI